MFLMTTDTQPSSSPSLLSPPPTSTRGQVDQPKEEHPATTSTTPMMPRPSCCNAARQNPTVALVPFVLLLALATAGVMVVLTTVENQNDVAKQEALELAQSTGAWFSDQLDRAILPLFSLAQFATELDSFHDLPDKIGPKDGPNSLPFVLPSAGKHNNSNDDDEEEYIPTHRNVTHVCTEPELVERFDKIASTIKRNAGMQGILVNLQLAPQAVVCLVHPLNNTQDFDDGMYLDSTGAVGHDLLNDPARKFIAQATVPADSVVIAGPLTLKQCQECDPTVKQAFIARLPIATDSGHEITVDGVSYPRWGFAVAIINWLALVERSNIYQNFSSRGLTFRLTRTDRIENNNGQLEEKLVVLAQAPNWDTKQWETVTVALETTNNEWEMTVGYENGRNKAFIGALTAVVVLSVLLGALLYTIMAQKQTHASVQEEQAALLVKSAQDAMAAERELNDYIAHEVRNPLSAAIAASSFVNAAVEHLSTTTTTTTTTSTANTTTASRRNDDQGQTLQSIREDMVIVDQSLHFINDLLRSMLDMHRAASRQICLQVTTLSVKDDIFLPVRGMLYQRDEGFSVEIDCPSDLTIQADRLRLQQVILNLARNAAKFVTRGFIRLRAVALSSQEVVLSVEDSGPGIPMDKRSNLFKRYQESLDSLNQGTGVGLYLVKNLVDLMEGSIYLDESFVSGVDGFPGTRIVVQLQTAITAQSSLVEDCPEEHVHKAEVLSIHANTNKDEILEDTSKRGSSTRTSRSESAGSLEEDAVVTSLQQQQPAGLPLPDGLNVLLVDDDRTLRKMARRCLQRLVPTWNIWEAASGEMALSMVLSNDQQPAVSFDLIFMDQYMTTCAGQALKGTETTRQLRARGIHAPIICGLSANGDMETPFLNCGANAFWLKPFPCQVQELETALWKLVAMRDDGPSSSSSSSSSLPPV